MLGALRTGKKFATFTDGLEVVISVCVSDFGNVCCEFCPVFRVSYRKVNINLFSYVYYCGYLTTLSTLSQVQCYFTSMTCERVQSYRISSYPNCPLQILETSHSTLSRYYYYSLVYNNYVLQYIYFCTQIAER